MTDDASPGPVEAPAPKRRHRGRRFALIFFTGLVVIALVAGGGLYFYSRHIVGQVGRVPDVFKIPEAERASGGAKGDLNILLAGSDVRAEGGTTGKVASGKEWAVGASRSDAIMVLHVNAARDAAHVVSIPRDSWVTIPGKGKNKINAAFSLGGPSLYVKTVEKLTGVRIDHLAVIDFRGFQQLTNALGGVKIEIPEEACGYDVGRYAMDGKEALEYVRQRKCLADGDFGRVKRQQNFLRTLLGQTLAGGTFKSPRKVNGVLNAVTKNLSVDEQWSGGDMRKLAISLRNVRSSDIQFMTVPIGDPATGREGAASVVYLDRAKGDDLWEAVRKDDVGTYLATTQGADVLGKDVN